MLGIISWVVGGGHVSIRIGIMNVDIAPAGCQETVKSIYSLMNENIISYHNCCIQSACLYLPSQFYLLSELSSCSF